MAKTKPADSWGNVKASKFNQKALERQRKKRMQTLNEENGAMREQVITLQNQKLDLEDAFVILKSDLDLLREDLLIAKAEAANAKRALRKLEKAAEAESTIPVDLKLIGYDVEAGEDPEGL